MGITFGPVKGDVLVDASGPKILEMAARLSGDYFCWETVPLHNGTDLLGAVMDQALGLRVNPLDLEATYSRGVALRYLWPKPGRVTSISGIREAAALPGVRFFRWEPRWRSIREGVVITAARSHGERVASVMTVGATRQAAIKIAEHALGLVRVETE